MALEQGEGLGKFLYKIAEIASGVKKVVRGPRAGETVKMKVPDRMSQSGVTPDQLAELGMRRITRKEQQGFKDSSERWFKKMSSVKDTEKALALAELQGDLLSKSNIDEVRPVLQIAVNRSGVNSQLIRELSINPVAIANPQVAESATRLALLPLDLQNNPYVVQREIARFSLSTKWNSITGEQRREAIQYIKNGLSFVRKQVDALNLSRDEKKLFSQATINILESDFKNQEVVSISMESARTVENQAIETMGRTQEMKDAEFLREEEFLQGVPIPDPVSENDPELKRLWEKMRLIYKTIISDDPSGAPRIRAGELRNAESDVMRLLKKEIPVRQGSKDKQSYWIGKENSLNGLKAFSEELSRYREAIGARGERFNTIYVSQKETEEFLRNFILFFETRSMKVEKLIFQFGYDSDMLQNQTRRIDLLAQWFADPDFEGKLTRGEIFNSDGLPLDIKRIQFGTPEQHAKVLEYRNTMVQNEKKWQVVKTDVLDGFHNRQRIHEVFFALNQSADPFKDQRVQAALLGLSDRGIFGALRHYGTLADYAAHVKIPTVHKNMLQRLDSVINRRSTAEVAVRTRAETAKQLVREAPRLQSVYKTHLAYDIEKLRGLVSEKQLASMLSDVDKMTHMDEDLAECVTNMGWALYSLDFRQNATTQQFGLEPALADLFGELSTYRGSSWEDSFMMLWRPVSYHLRKYGDLTDAQRVSLHGRGLAYIAKDDRFYKSCAQETQKLWGVIHDNAHKWGEHGYFDQVKYHFETHLEDPFSTAPPELVPKMKEYVEFVKLRGIFSEYHKKLAMNNDEKFAHFLTKIGKFKSKAFQDERDNLFYYVRVHRGLQLYERDAINPYGIWESGAFHRTIRHALMVSEDYGHYFHPDYKNTTGLGNKENGLMVGAELLRLADQHYNSRVHHSMAHEVHEATKNFIAKLGVGAKTHPHELYRLRIITEGTPVIDSVKLETFDKCTEMFGAIQHAMKQAKEIPLNYADRLQQNWTSGQKTIFDNVYDSLHEAIGITKDEYLDAMKEYSDTVIGRIHDFENHKYAKTFANVLWTDDVPLAEVEIDAITKAASGEANNLAVQMEKHAKGLGAKMSERVSHVGKARQSIFGITWMDHVVLGQNQLTFFIDTMSPDLKTATEGLAQLNKFIFMYNSEEAAQTSLAAGMAGFADAAKNRYWRFFKGLQFSSYLRRTAGQGSSPSFDVEDAHGFFDRLQGLRSAVRLTVPAMSEALDEIAGISNWRSTLTGRVRIPDIPIFLQDTALTMSNGEYVLRLNPFNPMFQGHTLEEVVEWLDTYAPNKLLTYKVQNGLLFIGAGTTAFAIATAAGSQGGGEEEHKS